MNLHTSPTTLEETELTMPGGRQSGEIRQSARPRRGHRLGYLMVNGQTAPVPCTVRDLAEGKATLIMGGWLGIPEQFSLYVEPDEIRLECRIAGRRGNAVTVSFDSLVNEARPRLR